MATKREIGVNAGATDAVGVVDTDAKDVSGNSITAQAVAALGPTGDAAEVSVRGELSVEATALNQIVEQNRTIILLLAKLYMQLGDLTGEMPDDDAAEDFVPDPT